MIIVYWKDEVFKVPTNGLRNQVSGWWVRHIS